MTDGTERESSETRRRARQAILAWAWITIGLTCFAAFLYVGWTRHEGDPISEAGLCLGLIAFPLSATAFFQARDWITRVVLIIGIGMLTLACMAMMSVIIHN